MSRAIILCAAALALAGCGGAVTRPMRVLVISAGEGDAEGDAARIVESAVSERGDLRGQGLGRLASLAARASAGELSGDVELQAERELLRAHDAFSEFDYASATTHLGEALRLLAPRAVRESGRHRLAALHLELALVLLVHGAREAAVEETRTAQHLDPSSEPDPGHFPPELVALYGEVRDLVRSADATGDVRVSSTPSGAMAQLDGREPKSTPMRWYDIPEGRHYLTIQRDGYLPDVAVVAVTRGQLAERHVALTPGPREVRAAAALREVGAFGAGAEAQWLATAARLGGAEAVLVAQMSGASLALAAFSHLGEPLGRHANAAISDDAAVRRWLEEAIPPPRTQWYGQWWFWTPIAAVLAAGAGAVVYSMVRIPDVTLVGGEVEAGDR